MATKRRKKDGRASNGRKPTGLTERSILVEMPKNLLDGVEACAQRAGKLRSQWIREALRSQVELQMTAEALIKAAGAEPRLLSPHAQDRIRIFNEQFSGTR